MAGRLMASAYEAACLGSVLANKDFVDQPLPCSSRIQRRRRDCSMEEGVAWTEAELGGAAHGSRARKAARWRRASAHRPSLRHRPAPHHLPRQGRPLRIYAINYGRWRREQHLLVGVEGIGNMPVAGLAPTAGGGERGRRGASIFPRRARDLELEAPTARDGCGQGGSGRPCDGEANLQGKGDSSRRPWRRRS